MKDKFGVSWQLSLGKISDIDQKITPMLMYNGSQYGKAEEAIEFYTAIFKKSGIQTLLRYQGRAEFQNGKISHGQFSLLGKNLAAMDSPISQDLSFSKGNSFVVNCETQVEVDYYLNELSLHKGKIRNGWVEDKYGVWWQITLLKQELN